MEDLPVVVLVAAAAEAGNFFSALEDIIFLQNYFFNMTKVIVNSFDIWDI